MLVWKPFLLPIQGQFGTIFLFLTPSRGELENVSEHNLKYYNIKWEYWYCSCAFYAGSLMIESTLNAATLVG